MRLHWSVPVSLLAAGATVLAACGSERRKPTEPSVRAECRVPRTTSFVDSAQGRVVAGNFSFAPTLIHVRRGQSVRWVHCGPELEAHTVTANDGAFDSGAVPKDSAFTHTFSAVGTFPYHCTPHPFMEGTIVVDP